MRVSVGKDSVSGSLPKVLDYVRSNRERFADELFSLCRTESVSALGQSLRPTADAVATLLARAGVEVSLVETGGQPVVVGRASGRHDRTILFYNHYDVQPPDPLNEWVSPPFQPAVREGRLYARGSADNKGNLLARIQAVEAWNRAGGAARFGCLRLRGGGGDGEPAPGRVRQGQRRLDRAR